MGQWIPPNERSQFTSAYMGIALGHAIFLPLFGFLLSLIAWEWVFHLSGIIGIIWFCFWQYFVYDTPSTHPHIHPMERAYIEEALGNSVNTDDASVSIHMNAYNINKNYISK